MPEDSPRASKGPAVIRIRAAQRFDIDDLVRLEAKAFASDRLSRRRLAAHTVNSAAALLVATTDGEIAGYALVLMRRGSSAARLYSLAVDPDMSGQGVGSTLLAAAEEAALSKGAAHLRLEVRVDNDAAIRLYERGGYRLVGHRENYYEDGAAALRYVRSLSAATRPVSTGRLRRAA